MSGTKTDKLWGCLCDAGEKGAIAWWEIVQAHEKANVHDATTIAHWRTGGPSSKCNFRPAAFAFKNAVLES